MDQDQVACAEHDKDEGDDVEAGQGFGRTLVIAREPGRQRAIQTKLRSTLRRTMLPVSVSRGRRWSTGGSWPVLGGMGSARLGR